MRTYSAGGGVAAVDTAAALVTQDLDYTVEEAVAADLARKIVSCRSEE